MKTRLAKKAMDIPIHWLIIFVIFLIIIILVAFSSFSKSEGLVSNLFSAIRGGGG